MSEAPYEACDFSSPDALLRLPCVRIGASGTPADGQTLWNVVTHQRLWALAGVPDMFAATLPLRGNDEVERIYQDLIRHGSCPAATQLSGCPYGRWSYCNRRSPVWGQHEFILNVGDYAGEIGSRMTIEDASRQRLLDCDGFVMFIDPTKEPDYCLSALDHFFADLRIRRCRSLKHTADIPVALVVPKLDLLTEAAACDNIPGAARLIEDIRRSGPTNEATTLEAIERRSLLVRKLPRDVVAVDRIVEMAEAVVGPGGVMAFPVATLGWHEWPAEHLGSLGREAAHEWLLAHSFGVLDPVLWVLHRLGLRRLPARSSVR